jgi:hypothetical protein
MPEATIFLPKYLFDLYQTSSVGIVLRNLNPYNQLGLTFSSNNGNPDIISDKPTKIKIVINNWKSFIVIFHLITIWNRLWNLNNSFNEPLFLFK